MTRTIESAAYEAAARLRSAGAPEPERDARLLARWAAGLDATGFADRRLEPMASEAWARLETAIAERAARRPVSHIVGARVFFGRSFRIDGRALDPRPESETLVAAALAFLHPDRAAPRVLDLGVGSGALLLSVLAERPAARGLGIDVSTAALGLAAENAERLGLAERVELRRGDWLDGVASRFDAALCNPPYISEAELEALSPEVRRHDPIEALTPGADGLAIYKLLAPKIGAVLAPNGAAFFEVGRGQAGAVAAIFAASGLKTAIEVDLGGVERVVRVVNDDAAGA